MGVRLSLGAGRARLGARSHSADPRGRSTPLGARGAPESARVVLALALPALEAGLGLVRTERRLCARVPGAARLIS